MALKLSGMALALSQCISLSRRHVRVRERERRIPFGIDNPHPTLRRRPLPTWERYTGNKLINVQQHSPMSQLHDFIEPRVIARLKALPLHARLPMLGKVTGMHRSPHRGSSLEFAEYRKYVPGDDTRRLDWRAYGRSDRFYIKEFEADTNLRLCLIVDTSGSMNFSNGGQTKLEFARRLAGTLAYLAAQQGDAIGLYCAGETFDKQIPPKRNAAHLRVVLDELANVKAAGSTGLPQACMKRLNEFVNARWWSSFPTCSWNRKS